MAPSTRQSQPFAKLAVLAFHARRIALEIYRCDRKDVTADLAQLTPDIQDEYQQIATVVALQNDPDALRPALYAEADALVVGGIGGLTPAQRAAAVGLFARGLRAMKRHLAGVSPADQADLMRALVGADIAAGIDQQVVTSSKDLAFDLSTADVSAEVH